MTVVIMTKKNRSLRHNRLENLHMKIYKQLVNAAH